MKEKFKQIKGGIASPLGYTAAGVACGIKKTGKKDMAFIVTDEIAMASGVFTKNSLAAAPVEISRENLDDNKAKAIIINSGNANSCTGKEGRLNALKMCEEVSKRIKSDPKDILVSSTGMIGIPLPMNKIKSGIEKVVAAASKKGGNDAAQAIMTTDTHIKEIAIEMKIDGKAIRVGGMAKGSGMISPNMATMISVITTDAAMGPITMKEMLRDAVDESFNSITIDGDMSTNDSVFFMANGKTNIQINQDDPAHIGFKCGLKYVLNNLAKLIIKDGEGATKSITIHVKGAKTVEQARKMGFAIANSTLVKCAFFGEDLNWGRIMAAIGATKLPIDINRLDLSMAGEMVFSKGRGISYCAETVKDILQKKDVTVNLDLHQGKGEAKIMTTDLSDKYIHINADYRT